MAKAGWTDEDEKALLSLLQKKWHSENSGSGYSAGSSVTTPLESQGAMTDGSKRLREAMADDDFDLISSATAAEFVGEQLPVMPITLFPGIADQVLDQLTADLVPEGMNFREWSRAKFAFGKFANSGKSYRDVYVDDEMAGILQMEHGSPWEQECRANCKGLAFFSLCMQSCGGLRLESQRVTSQGLWCRDSWVTKIVFMQQPSAGNTMSWLFIG